MTHQRVTLEFPTKNAPLSSTVTPPSPPAEAAP